MVYRFDGYNYLIRLAKGERLIESLTQFTQERLKGKSFWLSGIGGAQWAELGFYDLAQKVYIWKQFERLTEVTSLQGNLAWTDGSPVWHIHATLSDATFQAFGGHIKELVVAGTCELLLHAVQGESVLRKTDNDTGLKLLAL